MRTADFAELLRTLALDVREFIAQAIAPLTSKQAELETRLAALADPEPAPRGEPGDPGKQGEPGPSAFEVACAAGFTGTQAEWLASLRGADGEPGQRGADGKGVTLDDLAPMLRCELALQVAALPRPADGQSVTVQELRPMVRELVDSAVAALPPPRDGKDGTSISADEVVELVDAAVASVPRPSADDVRPIVRELVDAAVAALPAPSAGKDGKSVGLDEVRPLVDAAIAALPKARDGENVPLEVVAALVAGEVAKAMMAAPRAQDGAPGRDAAAIEPLPAIDAARSYPRGTWAKHLGGLWLARSTTDGMAGWDCLMVGVAGLEMDSDGTRTITLKAVLSDGSSQTTKVTLPTLVHKGAWAEGAYEHGDTVSWDGSLWHCERATTERPGTPDWKLCVKRGRDGKDGVRGLKGDRGDEGRAGRDLTQLGFNGQRT